VLALLLVALTVADLPPPARDVLDREVPGWKLAPIAPQVRDWFAQQHFGHEPDLAHFDFDLDGVRDWALEIIVSGRQLAVMLLARGSGFEFRLLASDSPDPFTYLLVNRRGDREFNFATLRWFRHPHDTLQLMYFDRPPLLFEWSNGRIEKRIVPNDEETDTGEPR